MKFQKGMKRPPKRLKMKPESFAYKLLPRRKLVLSMIVDEIKEHGCIHAISRSWRIDDSTIYKLLKRNGLSIHDIRSEIALAKRVTYEHTRRS